MSTSEYAVASKDKFRKLIQMNSIMTPCQLRDEELSTYSDEDIAYCVMHATLEGNEALARELFERKGPVPIVYRQGGENQFSTVNGQELTPDRSNILRRITSASQLKSLLRMIVDFGIKGLIEPGETWPALFTDRAGFTICRKTVFLGELPFLDNGVLQSPELAVSLFEESSHSAVPAAYDHVLCWATGAMLKQFPQNLAAFTTHQEVAGHITLKEWLSSEEADGVAPESVVTGVRPTETSSAVASQLFHYMGPESAHFGFEDEQGRFLCETTVNFLMGFPAGATTFNNLEAAQHFVGDYCPMDIISSQVYTACIEQFDHEPTYRALSLPTTSYHSRPYNLLFGLLAKDHPLRDRAMAMMPRDTWQHMVLRSRGLGLDTDSLVALYDAFGIDNTGLMLKLHAPQLRALMGTGFQFADNTQVFEWALSDHVDRARKESETKVSLMFQATDFLSSAALNQPSGEVSKLITQAYIDLLGLNLWPAEGEKPTSLAEVLALPKTESYSQKELAAKAYMVNEGVDACVQLAKTPAQWARITDVFSGDELTPYLHLMPGSAKGVVLESVLGL